MSSKNKKKSAQVAVADDDLDDLLAEFGHTGPTAAANKTKGGKDEGGVKSAGKVSVGGSKATDKPDDGDDNGGDGDDGGGGEEGGDEVTAKTLKNRLKKQKKKQQQKGAADEPSAAAATSSPSPSPSTAATGKGSGATGKGAAKAKGGAMSAAAKLAQERLRLLQEEEKQRAEEKRLAEEEEKKRLLEEEMERKRIEEEKARRLQAKKDKKERLKREGKPVTAAAKEKARRGEMARQMFVQMQGEQLIAEPPTGTSTTVKRSKCTETKKKKKPQQEKVMTDDQVEQIDGGEDGEEREKEVETQSQPVVVQPPVKKEEDDWEQAAWGSDEEKAGGSPNNAPKTGNGREGAGISDESGDDDDDDDDDDDEEDDEEEDEEQKKSVDPKKGTVPSLPSSSLASATTTPPRPPQLSNKEMLAKAKLRSPICCILGHVDTGKTKLLDKIRHSNVQGGEAGGITQQIGATFFPQDSLWEQCRKVEPELEMRVPGLLIIDTPGHQSFNNLRTRGSSLCDIATLVVDIMHGLEPQTRESIGLLKARKCPFIVALNKIDRLYAWTSFNWMPSQTTLKQQKESTQEEFDTRLQNTLLQLAEEGLHCDVWWKIEDQRKTVSVAPTSAITGEGIPDLLLLLVKLTQTVMTKALVYKDEFQCTILEVKAIEGLGTTIDVILVNGYIEENDKIVVCGMSGPIVATVRALLTPQPLKELRVKGEYIHNKIIHAAMGIKISAQGLEEAVAGTSVLLARDVDDEELELLKDEVMSDMASIFTSVDRSGVGVYVMASTLGSLEALLQFLKDSKIPVFAVNLGPVHKLDVKKASIMREKGRPELCCILAFDVKVDTDAEKEAKTLGVKIFTADIIYHLFDSFNAYVAEEAERQRKEKATEVVFPCILSILQTYIFNKKDPIVVGVKVEEGQLRMGTPLCIPSKEGLYLGKVAGIEHNKKPVQKAKKGEEVALKIQGDSSLMYGRHFDHTNKIYSRMNRDAINLLKEHFKEELTNDDWRLVMQLKKTFSIL